MKARRVREASRIAPAIIPMLLLVLVLRKATVRKITVQGTTVRRTIVRKTTALFLVLVLRKTAPEQLRTIARVRPGRMKHHGQVRRGAPRSVRVG